LTRTAIGTAVGALLGAIINGGKGAAIGAEVRARRKRLRTGPRRPWVDERNANGASRQRIEI